MALHRGSVSFPLVCVHRGHRLSCREEPFSAFCHVSRQMAMSSHSFLGNYRRAAELIAARSIAARRTVEEVFRYPRDAPAHAEQM